eukprot:8378520-Lingulodinium_polyedra.AAC.1
MRNLSCVSGRFSKMSRAALRYATAQWGRFARQGAQRRRCKARATPFPIASLRVWFLDIFCGDGPP